MMNEENERRRKKKIDKIWYKMGKDNKIGSIEVTFLRYNL